MLYFSYRKSGCAALDMAYVAAGRYDGYFQDNLNLWDIAAGIILINACMSNVSDIHIEPKGSDYKIRVRRDGVMQKFLTMPNTAGRQLIACMKNMASMDIAERRASQDGKIYRRYNSKKLEFRCSIFKK